MRKLFEHIRQLVEKRYPQGHSVDSNRELSRQSVSAFCFLRFIVPAILHPHLFGLCSGESRCSRNAPVREQSLRSPRSARPTKSHADRKSDSKPRQPQHGMFYLVFSRYHADRVCIDCPERRVHARCQVLPGRKDTGDAGLYPCSIHTKSKGIFSTTVRSACSEPCHQSSSRKEAGDVGSTKRVDPARAVFRGCSKTPCHHYVRNRSAFARCISPGFNHIGLVQAMSRCRAARALLC